MKTLLWLDDVRVPSMYIGNPIGYNVVWVKSYEEFIQHIKHYGVPDIVYFDHDLGTEKSGYDAAKFLGEWCEEEKIPLPQYNSQSANPIGKKAIFDYLESVERFLNKQNS